LLSHVSEGSPVKIVYSGGIRDAKDVLECFEHPAISGVAIGSALHYGRIRVSDLKSELFGTSNPNGEASH
jgi:phosphoribosylformimino-5-aminoimidazole carboxamide ribonucleotide (ProFAR) isomerase